MALHLTSTGIDFSDISSGELLDDYEEGTFTHTVGDGSNLMTLDMPTGSFTKIGKAVSIGGHARSSSLGSVSGGIYLGGFPFQVGEGAQSRAGGACSYSTGLAVTGSENYGIHSNEDTSRSMINLWNAGAGTAWAQHTWWSADGSTVYGLTYFVAP